MTDSNKFNSIMLKIYMTYVRLRPENLDAQVYNEAERDVLLRALRPGLLGYFQELGYEVSEDDAMTWHARWLYSPRPIVDFRVDWKTYTYNKSLGYIPHDDCVVVEASAGHQTSVSELSEALAALGFVVYSGDVCAWRSGINGSEFIEFVMPQTTQKARKALIRQTAALLTSLGYDGAEWALRWTEKTQRS